MSKQRRYYRIILALVIGWAGFNIIQAIRYHYDVGFLSSVVFCGSLLALGYHLIRGKP